VSHKPDQILSRKLTLNDLNLVLVVVVHVLEDCFERAVNRAEDLVIVLIDGHLEIQTRELGQVSVGVTVLRTEHRADLEHAAEVGRNGHLLAQLGRLREESGAAEVVDLEHARAGFRRHALQLGRVDLDEILAV